MAERVYRGLSRRQVLQFGGATLITAVLAACSQAAAPAPTQQASSPAQAPTPTTQPAAQATASTAAVHVSFWHYNDAKHAGIMQSIADDFVKANPNITPDLLAITVGDIIAKIEAAVAGNAGPDIVYSDLVQVPTYWKAGVIVPLDDFIRAENIDMKDFYDAFVQYSMQEGKYFSVPFEGNLPVMLWNKTLFGQNGLDPEKPPQSWDEVVTFGQKVTNADKRTLGFQLPFTPTGPGISIWWGCLQWEAGGSILKPDAKGRVERGWPDIDSSAGALSWGYYVDLFQKYKIASVSPPAQAFGAGVLGMEWIPISSVPSEKTTAGAKFQVGVARFPPKQQYAGWSGGAHLVLMKGSKVPDQAKKFMSYMLGPHAQLRWETESGFTPPRKSAVASPEYKAWLDKNPDYKVAGDMLPFVQPRPPIPLQDELMGKISLALEPALHGPATAPETLKAAQAAITQLFKDNNYNPDTAP
jgi:ABC-type glycerol-3-phosphate transport system substrate-binding protein